MAKPETEKIGFGLKLRKDGEKVETEKQPKQVSGNKETDSLFHCPFCGSIMTWWRGSLFCPRCGWREGCCD